MRNRPSKPALQGSMVGGRPSEVSRFDSPPTQTSSITAQWSRPTSDQVVYEIRKCKGTAVSKCNNTNQEKNNLKFEQPGKKQTDKRTLSLFSVSSSLFDFDPVTGTRLVYPLRSSWRLHVSVRSLRNKNGCCQMEKILNGCEIQQWEKSLMDSRSG